MGQYDAWNVACTGVYQKVGRLISWNQYLLGYAYKFCREYKTTNVVLIIVKFYAKYVDN